MAEKPAQKFEIQKIYIKDLSFETPNSPKIFTEKWNPKTDVHIQTENNKLDENLFEVAIVVTVTATQNETTAFLVEVKQAGIFLMENFPEEQHKQLLGSYCPNILFPFARESVAELVAKGGFPQLLLNPVNFDALYQQHINAVKEQKENPEQIKH
ncbi:MAG: protein-export chaperone SecB [Pseudomonadota bacterium]